MKAVICRGIKDYLKNPIYWFGILLVIISIYGSLSIYAGIHFFSSNKELEELGEIYSVDVDIMDGYIPAKEEEQIENGLEGIKTALIENYEMTQKDAAEVIDDVKAKALSVQDTIEYLQEEYNFYDGKAYLFKARQKKVDADGANEYISAKLLDHSFAYYFSRKYADIAGVHMAFFACVILAFLYIRDMKKDTYELLHTKPVSAEKYIWGKFLGGLVSLAFALLIITVLFSGICQKNPLQEEIFNNFGNMFLSTILYVFPTIFIVSGIYTLVAVLFKNPLPALPLVLTYIIYSNMGSYDRFGNYGFHGRLLGMLFRFDGFFFETKTQPIFLLNQVTLIVLTSIFIFIAVGCWKRRRV